MITTDYFDYWTVQDRSVLETLKNEERYCPKIQNSSFLNAYDDDKCRKEIERLYNIVCTGIALGNDFIPSDIQGVVFAFAAWDKDNQKIWSLKNYDMFYRFIQMNKDKLETYWNKCANQENNVILHLRLPNRYNPVAIDFNGWSFLMPPHFIDDQRTIDARKSLEFNLARGESQYTDICGEQMDDVMQCHLPGIHESNVIGIYPMFEMTKHNRNSEPNEVYNDYLKFILTSITKYNMPKSLFPYEKVREAYAYSISQQIKNM